MLDFMKASGKKVATPVGEQAKYEIARKEVESLSLQAKEHAPIEKVPEQGKFLKLGSHKVTGKELNTTATHVDESIIETKKVQIETLRHIDQLYQALDALDAEHIAGILAATEAAEKAKDLANINDQNIGKIISYLTQDDRVLAYRNEQESRIATLERKIKTVYLVAGSAVLAAVVGLATCLIALL